MSKNAKISKIRYQIVSSNNAIAALEDGTVHYISPSLTTDNYEKLDERMHRLQIALVIAIAVLGFIAGAMIF